MTIIKMTSGLIIVISLAVLSVYIAWLIFVFAVANSMVEKRTITIGAEVVNTQLKVSEPHGSQYLVTHQRDLRR